MNQAIRLAVFVRLVLDRMAIFFAARLQDVHIFLFYSVVEPTFLSLGRFVLEQAKFIDILNNASDLFDAVILLAWY